MSVLCGRSAGVRSSASLEIELLLFWFCLHGEALEQQHSDHSVSGAMIQT